MSYAKAALAVVATIASAIVAAMTDGGVTTAEWINVAIGGVGAASVFAAPNVPGARYSKAILAALAAVLTFLVSAVAGGVSPAEWLQILVVALGALGVYAVPNRPPTATARTTS